jgi:hypothetical protein
MIENFILVKGVNRKDPHEFLRLRTTKQKIEDLEKELGSPVFIVKRGGNNLGGTWLHSELYKHWKDWANSPKRTALPKFEDAHTKALAKSLDGQCFVDTLVGQCDVVTKEYAIEVKTAKAWKSAIGQAQAYAYFLSKKPGIYLFDSDADLACKEVCNHIGIRIFDRIKIVV